MFKKIFLMGVLLLAPMWLFAKKEALIVAVGKYQNKKIRELHVDYDIERMRYLLKKRGFNIKILYNKEATLRNVVKQLKSYQNLSSNDVFVLYNTLHGVQIKDQNNDERDHKDEAFALYDVTVNNHYITDVKGLLVDDELDILLSKIHAKKLMITDACHSGSIHKGISFGQVKNLKASPNIRNNRKLFRRVNLAKPTNFISISASKDNQISMDNRDGGVFTNALYEVWDRNPNITFRALTIKIRDAIKKQDPKNKQQPQLYTSRTQSSSTKVNLYLENIKSHTTPKRRRKIGFNPIKYLNSVMRSHKVGSFFFKPSYNHYRVGSHIKFKVNTKRKMGYLYIFSINSRAIKRVFPNDRAKNSHISVTKFYFPDSRRFDMEATISSSRLRAEKIITYAILAQKQIRELEYGHKITSKSLKRAFRNRHNQISIAKSQFTVTR